MQIAIIGGSGFIGTRLTQRLLKSGYKVKIIDKNTSYFHSNLVTIADVRNVNALSEALKDSDVVINLAAEHKDNVTPRSLYDEVNVLGAKNICEAANKNNISKIIFTSSVAVYGFAEANTDEDGKFNPFNDYGRTKMEAEAIFSEWQKLDAENRSLVIVRPTVVFGERNRGNVYNLFDQIANGHFMMIGSGKNKKSMAYVGNITGFIEHALLSETGIHIYNYADKPDMDMNFLVKTVNMQLGKSKRFDVSIPYWLGYIGGLCFDLLSLITRRKFPISSIRVKKFCATTQFASEKKLETGFVPETDIKEAIRRTIKYEFIEQNKIDDVLFYTE